MRSTLLDSISSPADIKKLDVHSLELLAQEIRKSIISIVRITVVTSAPILELWN